MLQLAMFHIGTEIYGINIILTKEIGKFNGITKVPGSEKHFLGLMNLRGQIVTVMEPGILLDAPSELPLEERKIIILKTEEDVQVLRKNNLISDNIMSNDPVAIVVDQIDDVIEVEPDHILPPPPNLVGLKKEIVAGIVQIESDLIVVLAIDKLLQFCGSPQRMDEFSE